MAREGKPAMLLCLLLLAGCDDPDDVPATHISAVPAPPAAGTVERHPQRIALFGDLHVHTSWSFDAYAGDNRLGPNTAYRFARGERVELPSGREAQLDVPLDFVALTDHAEGFSTLVNCTVPGEPEFDTGVCRSIRAGDQDQADMLRDAFARGTQRPARADPALCPDPARCAANARSTWQRVQALANAHDDPGRFTALIGYEFSSVIEDFGMLHRNVVFRGEEVVPHAVSSLDVRNQRELFARLDETCEAPCEVLTIPHNSNFSWGLIFARSDEDGEAYTAEDLERRARLERVFEITQQKGNSECALGVGAADEDCDYGNLFPPCEPGRTTRCVGPASLYRDGLLEGLTIGAEGGVNPHKVGVIGSTDTHYSDPGNTRAGPPGQFTRFEGRAFVVERLLDTDHPVVGPVRRFLPGGLAGVWAEANTRADVFDALQRREAFGTSGTRMRIRFFAGGLPEDIAEAPDPVAVAYETGVPMGADLPPSDAPLFWVWASQDPLASKLDRIQIVKGWLEDGEQRQRVWDVACAGGQAPDANHRCPEPEAVDATTCEPVSGVGDGMLQATFSDPDFSAEQPAFYYARVLESPTCRWTTVMSREVDLEPPGDVPAVVQERGWSSPIWVASP